MANAQLSAHYESQTSVKLSVLWHEPGGRRDLSMEVTSPDDTTRVFELPATGWTELAPWRPMHPDWPSNRPFQHYALLTQHVTMTGLRPGAQYTAEIRYQLLGTNVMTCRFETLPSLLPPETSATGAVRPFTVLIASCYSAEDDPGREVSAAYERLLRAGVRPHVKFLLGDQVYVDQPSETFMGISSAEIRHHVATKYVEAWQRMGALLSDGMNHFSPDDHEYWNDYPNAPDAVWFNLSTSENTRKTMKTVCEAFTHHVQHVRRATTFTLGPPDAPRVALYALDTRSHRTTKTGAFLDPASLSAFVTWLDTLVCPGIIFVSGPIFDKLYSFAPVVGFKTDTHLPAYDDFRVFSEALSRCQQDLIVCAGDPHYGRLSTIRLPKPGGRKSTRLWEVISSPLTCLDTPFSKAVFRRPVEVDLEGTTTFFPALTDEQRQAARAQHPLQPTAAAVDAYANEQGWPRVQYLKDIPTTAQGNATKNHFMTLSVAAGTGAEVVVDVSAWLINDPPSSNGAPALAWTHRIMLNEEKPDQHDDNPSGSARVPSVLDKTRGTARQILVSAGFKASFRGRGGRVNAQEPAADSWAPMGSVVRCLLLDEIV